MMTLGKFHYNPATGRVSRCTAQFQCEFKLSEGAHSETPEEAQRAYEDQMGSGLSSFNRKRNPVKGQAPEYPSALLDRLSTEGVFVIPDEGVELMMSNDPEETWNGALNNNDTSTFVEMLVEPDETIGVLYVDGVKRSSVVVPRSVEGNPSAVRVYEMSKVFKKLKKSTPEIFGTTRKVGE